MANIVKSKVIFEKGDNEKNMLHNLEKIARTCYKSEDKMTEGSAQRLIKNLFNRNHMAIMEHEYITYRIICDRGVTHEIVRHRIANYAQESTRYVNYSSDKYNSEINVIDIATGFNYNLKDEKDCKKYDEWMEAMEDAEAHYMKLIELGATPQEARSVLPNSTKTEIVVTMNIREWLHFLKLRTDKAAHPQMREVANMIKDDLLVRYPFIFGECAKQGEKAC